MRAPILAAMLLAVSGCTIPRSGALKSELARPRAAADYVVQKLDAAAVAGRRAGIAPSLAENFAGGARPADDTIRPGDRLSMTIIESSGSLPSAINGMLKLDLVDVQPDGRLAVPYAGAVPVAGASIDQARQAIRARLSRKLYQPEVVLRMVDGSARAVSIVGDVGKGGSYPLGPNMTRLSDLIGAAGIASEKPGQVKVELRRAALRGRTTLKNILEDPSSNVYLQGGDVVSISRAPDYVTVIGAANTPGRVEIVGDGFSVLDALATTQGLNDNAADPSGVYVFGASDGEAGGPPVIYEIDIRDPAQIQLARAFRVNGGEVIYVSTASFAQTRKVLSAISGSLSTVSRIP